jgi:hypothetical protein
MKKQPENKKGIGRRQFLPVLGTGLLLPLLPVRAQSLETPEGEDEYRTLLKPDGTAVRVKVSSLKKSKVVRKQISNKDLLSWLGKDKEQT